ncbi:MAG: isopropylmalate isomerase, partial [Opitutales bacterium]|nr:isopropylmalate isomerase [Opitutales bacterium]
EHAPQSLWHYGFRAIIAESFAEIFFGNSTTIGIPCVCASASDIAKLASIIDADPSAEISVDLQKLAVSCKDFSCKCSMPENSRKALCEGTWDPIAELMDAEAQTAKLASTLPYMK